MTNPFEEIRSRLDIRTALEYYGVKINRNNTCLCPFHNDHHPSAYVYPNAFHCFTCNVHYDVIGFVMELFGLSALDAAKKLSGDFALGVKFGYEKERKNPKYSKKHTSGRYSVRNGNALKSGRKIRGRPFTITYGFCVIYKSDTDHRLRAAFRKTASFTRILNMHL